MIDHGEQLTVFLREIKDRPEDDVPRLILGDWLQDQGDSRGEFVHLQVRRARLRGNNPEAVAMYHRERELLCQHALEWLGPLADWASGWGFVRGFVHLVVRWDGQTRPRLPERSSCEAIRWVEGVRMRLRQASDLSTLFVTGLLAEVNRLDLSDVPLMTLRPLFRDEAAGLRTLFLRRTFLSDVEIERLAEAPALAGLRWLDLSGNRLRDANALALSASATLRNLSRLDVSENSFTSVGREALTVSFGDRVVLRGGGVSCND